MTRDKFDQLITESGIPMFYREDFELFPHQIRLFCQEKYRFLVEDFIWRQVPVRIWIEIITENYDYRAYRHPRFTFRDHLKDCFGWLTYKPGSGEFLDVSEPRLKKYYNGSTRIPNIDIKRSECVKLPSINYR